MRSTVTSLLLATSAVASATTTLPFPPFSGDPFKKLRLSAKGIKADFIPYGARLTNLWVNDKHGKPQDVAVGYDTGERYLQDSLTNRTFFGAVVGRYANRIKNGTFTIDGVTSHIERNEHGGADTLHGGFTGYDQANWTVVSHTANSLTFSFYDHELGGFPGDVLNVASYTLGDDQTFTSRLVSIPVNKVTPIMLSHHIYWNLDAFSEPTIFNNTLHMPYATRKIDGDGILVPTGGISLTKNTPLDFTAPGTTLGEQIPKAIGACGTGCVGIDNAFITDRNPYAGNKDPTLEVLTMSSPHTGIQMSVATDQDGIQIYTCTGMNGTVPVKQNQGGGFIEKYGCIVIETQDWIDGINQQQWGRNQYQVFSPTTAPAVNQAKFSFSVVGA